MEEVASNWTFELTGGALCLDFANTVSGMRRSAPVERIQSYADLISWGRQAGILTEQQAQQLLLESQRRPLQRAAALKRCLELREANYRIWYAIALKNEPPAEDIELLNRVLADALGKQRVKKKGEQWVLAWSEEKALDSVIWPVAKSAMDLLLSDDVARVRVCEATLSDECDWLFIDQTKNRARRWCSMESCGNRAKARRHYQRRKAGAGT